MATNRQRLIRLLVQLEPQPEGGYTVTSPVLPELVTEGDTIAEVNTNVADAFRAVAELYQDRGQELPGELYVEALDEPFTLVHTETPNEPRTLVYVGTSNDSFALESVTTR